MAGMASIPIHWLPENSAWQDLQDAINEALAHSQQMSGVRVRFTFRGDVFEITAGEETAQHIGNAMVGSTTSPYWHGRRPYLNWSVPPADPLDFPVVPQVPDNVASVEAAQREALRNMVDLMYRPSPVFERLRDRTPPQVFESQPFRSPFQYDTLGPLGPGRRASAVHLSEVAHYPGELLQDFGMKSPREMELERRLDTVKEILSLNPDEQRFGPLLDKLQFRHASPSSPTWTITQKYVSLEDSRRLVQALDYGAAQPTETYVYRYQFMNSNGSVSAMAMAGAEKLERGTILDAAARPIRKFRLVEE